MSENINKKIELPGSLTVRDLATRAESSPIQVIKILMNNGVMANINQLIDFDTAAVVLAEMGFDASLEVHEEVKEEVGEVPLWRRTIEKEDPKNLASRPPVVTILGHVDHGKTTLLDAIRNTQVAAGEAGGITQHIGAYQIEHKKRKITFLDTPGHAAFTAMRARGAQGADIVILVVAANDGVMPQTKEAIAHAKAARVPIIVALNKIDLPDANPDKVKQQLNDQGLVSDEWDGDTIIVPVSAKKKTGLDDLMEAILMVADQNKILANPNGDVIGTVIEAQVDHTKGVVATLLVQNGTLKNGDAIVVGNASGKIRAMFDFRGSPIETASPATPVQVMGLNEVPGAGELFNVVESERAARAVVAEHKLQEQEKNKTTQAVSLEDNNIDQDQIKVKVLHQEAGNINENDVMLAAASKGIVIGFNVAADSNAMRLAETEGVSVRLYEIIYRLVEDIEKALKGMLTPEKKEKIIGRAEVLAIFHFSKLGTIAGCKVTEGELRRNGHMRVFRAGTMMHEGELASLKREQANVREVRMGFECGLRIKNFNDFQVGDQLECTILEEVEQE
jgi:translation initiation factor IF-2